MKIAILGAMPQEIEYFMSIKDKFKPNLFIDYTGAGISDVSAKTQYVIDKYNPMVILFTGVAGSLNKKLNIGDIVIVDKAINYEMDLRGFDKNYLLGQHFLEEPEKRIAKSDEKLVDLCREYIKDKKNMYIGTATTGSKFLVHKSDIKELTKEYLNNLELKLQPDICDMETSALLRIANKNKVPALAIRVISDNYMGDSPKEFNEFIENGVKSYSPLIDYLLKEL